MNHEDKTMLALAALTYRGFGNHSEAVIARRLDPWLPALEAEGLGRWERAWGPASFRAPTSLVDDAMAYVAKQRDRAPGAPPRYVVAIRGTNPISLFDWVFGDMWVRHLIRWPKAPGARYSASTALGLAILQNLTAAEPPSTGGNFAPLANGLTSALQGFAREIPELLPETLLRHPAFFGEADLIARLNALTGNAGDALRIDLFDRVLEHFDEATSPLRNAAEQEVFDLLLRHVAIARGAGETLLQFLDRAVESGAQLTVVGHSKGGALALATALWLAEDFAPGKNVSVDCFTFAGPTAGDAAFAAHYDRVLGARTRCIVNRRDIVPQAWAVADLSAIGAAYPLLDLPTDALSRSVDTFGYTHVGGTQVAFTPPGGPPRDLVQELIFQHLDAYLIEAGFGRAKWNAISIFLDRA
jgi:hypothetical protein